MTHSTTLQLLIIYIPSRELENRTSHKQPLANSGVKANVAKTKMAATRGRREGEDRASDWVPSLVVIGLIHHSPVLSPSPALPGGGLTARLGLFVPRPPVTLVDEEVCEESPSAVRSPFSFCVRVFLSGIVRTADRCGALRQQNSLAVLAREKRTISRPLLSINMPSDSLMPAMTTLTMFQHTCIGTSNRKLILFFRITTIRPSRKPLSTRDNLPWFEMFV